MDLVQQTIGRVFRDEGARMLATVIRGCGGDFDLAEDALQDASAKAVESWAQGGIPDKPAAWLVTTARNRAVDLQRRKRLAPRPMAVIPDVADESLGDADAALDGAHVSDDRLRLLFTCCHPALAREARVSLALRTLAGLSTAEIARAFIESETTTAHPVGHRDCDRRIELCHRRPRDAHQCTIKRRDTPWRSRSSPTARSGRTSSADFGSSADEVAARSSRAHGRADPVRPRGDTVGSTAALRPFKTPATAAPATALDATD